MKGFVALLVGMSLALTSLTGCYGKFALTRKVYGINGDVKDKFLRSAVTWAFVIVPVYGGHRLWTLSSSTRSSSGAAAIPLPQVKRNFLH